ncbi:mpv17-like protein isoform X1 [Periplaneta americana]|uniref:mpv17-like protein isoform X1 n=1 Tax=Periplaneta americana TaxID=6978 RepID=UPI0037E7EA96
MATRISAAVKTIFKRYPMAANAVVYGTLVTGAEFSQQTITKKILVKDAERQEIDKGSLGRFAIMGTLIYPNVLYIWYRWLDSRYVGTATKTIVKKLLLDQFVLTPPLLCAFFVIMSAMERKDDIFEECRKKMIPTFQTSCMFWLPAQTLNFIFIPPVARVVYVGTCAFIWINILVWIKRQKY